MKLEKKWQLASCSVGMLSNGEMGPLEPSVVGERMKSFTTGLSEASVEAGEVALLLLLPLSDLAVSTQPLRPPVFCARLSVAFVSLRKMRSNSSL